MGRRKYADLELFIDEEEFLGRGSARFGDKRIVVKRALLGQKVLARARLCGREVLEGRLLRVLERAEGEVEPACPDFGACGGCMYQSLTYADETARKERLARALLAPFSAGAEYLGLTPSPVLRGYKNKMEYSFGDGGPGSALELGMRRTGGFYETVTARDCSLVDNDFRKIVSETLSFFRESGEAFYHTRRHTGVLRHLIIRKARFTGEILVNLETAGGLTADLGGYAGVISRLDTDGRVEGVLHTLNNSLSDAVKPEEVRTLFGRDFITEELFGLKFRVTPFSFFQTNSAGAEALYGLVRGLTEEIPAPGNGGLKVFDLYSGTGTIAQIIAGGVKEVTAVELVPEAAASARRAAEENGVGNCRFLTGDVLEVVKKLAEAPASAPDLIILDPPREGVSPKALPKIAGFGAGHILYVSCNPATLSRDMEKLAGFGYKCVKYAFCDMFPRAAHLESVALLRKNA
ncbi:MAG: 23S rRNA (uracil(1939)-C(5))-methyltransferase RlmD [Clostridiales bacterium]|jgi:23S rRNA (uracil-5-)-methyltransferase RumA|nr:23S rRNA (uracil(1939)-C(5))-methyltransferase RlmD [Clostridiales bacterium]